MNACLPLQRRAPARGQSLVEFLVALAVLMPLFVAITFAGRYGDLQQTATQASRYAAFQRAMQPNSGRLSDATIEDQMRARFFAAGDTLNKGRIQSDDSVSKLKKADTQPALWEDLSGEPLMKAYDQITLTWADTAIGTGAVASAMGVMTKTAGKSYPGGRVARVEVKLNNKLDQINDSPKPIVIAAATAAAGDGLSSSGSQGTRDAAATIVPTSYIPDALSGFLELAIDLFEPEGPKLGCIKPDVVAGNRLEGAANNSRCR